MACELQKAIDEAMAEFDKVPFDTTMHEKRVKRVLKAIHEGRPVGEVAQSETKVNRPNFTPARNERNELIDPLSEFITNSNSHVSSILASGMYSLEPWSTELAKKTHEWSLENLPLYENTADILSEAWRENDIVHKVRQYAMPDGKTQGTLNDLMTIVHNAHKKMLRRLNDTSHKLNTKLEAKYTPEQIETLDDIFAKAGLFGVVRNGYLHRIVNNEVTIDTLISELEETLGSNKHLAANFAKLYMNEDRSGTVALKNNISEHKDSVPSALVEDMDALIALYSLKKVDGSEKMLKDMYKDNRDIYNELTALSLHVKEMDEKIHSKIHRNGKTDRNSARGNLIGDITNEDYHMVAVTAEDVANGRYNERDGWKILRKPDSAGKYGIVYRENTATIQEGYGVNLSYTKTGVHIRPDIASREKYKRNSLNGIVESVRADGGMNLSLTLTKAERAEVGMLNNPVTSLMKSYAHKELIMETQVVRDTINESFTKSYKTKERLDQEVLEKMGENEHPIYISMPEGTALSDLDPKIQDNYMMVDKTILTSIGGLKESVDLVRKDLSDQVTGYRELEIFNSHKANLYVKRVKDIIRYAKINMIILNGPKIFKDFLSGMSIASAKGASFQEMYRYTREAVDGSKRLTKLLNDQFDAEYRLALSDDEVEIQTINTELEKIAKTIEDDSFSAALRNGFIQSMGTEMIAKDSESVQGLEVNMKKWIKKAMITNEGDMTSFHKLVKRVSPYVPVDHLYTHLGGLLEKAETTEDIGKSIREMGDRLKRVKSQEDMSDLMAELVATPDSQLVRVGSGLTIYADMLPRWVIYRHSINTGMTEKEAVAEALNSLLDYKVNMPKEMKFMSDLFLLPFPSFFVRIQRVILSLAKDNPVSFGAQMTVNDLLGSTGYNILGSNIITREQIFTNPFDAITFGNLTPYNNLL